MKFGSFTTTATAPLETIEKLIPAFLKKMIERYEGYYSTMYRPRSIEICAQNGALTGVKFIMSANPEAQKDPFLNQGEAIVTISASDVEGAIKTVMKTEIENETGATVEITEPKWASMNIQYKDGTLAEPEKEVVTVKCVAAFNKREAVNDASSNGTHKSTEKASAGQTN